MNFIHLGACTGDWNKSFDSKCGFTDFIKINSKDNDQIYLIEANPKNIPKLKESYKDYKNAEIINMGISMTGDNNVSFYYTEDNAPDYMISSLQIDHVKKHYPNSEIKEYKIKTITINSLFEDYVKNSNIDYLSIDVEGLDFHILMNINFQKYNITNISIEHLHLSRLQKRKMINHLLNHGYSYCGFGYDHNNFDYLFKKKKIFLNRILSKFLWLISKKHLHILNFFLSKKVF